jgi:hypothetical protein
LAIIFRGGPFCHFVGAGGLICQKFPSPPIAGASLSVRSMEKLLSSRCPCFFCRSISGLFLSV